MLRTLCFGFFVVYCSAGYSKNDLRIPNVSDLDTSQGSLGNIGSNALGGLSLGNLGNLGGVGLPLLGGGENSVGNIAAILQANAGSSDDIGNVANIAQSNVSGSGDDNGNNNEGENDKGNNNNNQNEQSGGGTSQGNIANTAQSNLGNLGNLANLGNILGSLGNSGLSGGVVSIGNAAGITQPNLGSLGNLPNLGNSLGGLGNSGNSGNSDPNNAGTGNNGNGGSSGVINFKKDWSDHALWWPTRNKWLSRPKHTLDQYSVHADAALHFTPMHKPIRIQLPDLRYIDCKIDFSIDTFSAVVQLCKSLGIRHPEELSLCYPLEPSHLKQNYQNLKEAKKVKSIQAPDTNTFIAATRGSSNSLDRSLACPATPPPPRSLSATPVASQQNGTLRRYGGHIYSTQSDGSSDGGYCGTPPRAASMDALDSLAELSLADSPLEPDSQSRESLLTPKSLMERARMNVGWLDSSLSVMEQYVREWDTLQLRFKFYSFFDLTPRAQDAPRLNQLYQQARWQILNQEVHCTEEEMLLFAALQLQIELQTLAGGGVDANDGSASAAAPEDDIDAALSELQVQLEGGPPARPDITHVPELAGYLKYRGRQRFTLRAYKRGWVSCRDGVLRIHSSQEAAAKGDTPSYAVELRGAEVTPDAHPASGRYGIKLEVPSEDTMHEMWLKCENEDEYAEWVAACRLGARGRSLADAAFTAEAAGVRALLALQRPQPAAALNQHSLPHLDHLQPENYLAPRFLKKLKGKFTQRVLESHANVKDLPLLEAKLQYIKTWQNLPDYGQTLFVVRFMGHRKDEIISIANNRIMRLDPNTGDHIKTWRYSTMKAWNVNWEIKHMMVQFEEGNIIFSVQSADCKVVHEFIGGYIFLSMRSKDANQTLDEELFHKLTGGWT